MIIRKLFGSIILIALLFIPFFSDAESIRNVTQNIERLKMISPPYDFALIGDSRDGENVYRQLIQRILEHKPAFIIHLGDMISKPNEKEWERFFKLSEPINIPFFPVVGNHDVDQMKLGEKIYLNQFFLPKGKTYYSFMVGDVLFITLDSEKEQCRIANEQLLWLENTLIHNKENYKLIFLHRPLFVAIDSLKIGKAMDRFPSERDQIHQLFIKTGVKAVFSGDDHRYTYQKVDGIHYIITGGGGAPLYATKERGGYFHFVLVSYKGNRIEGKVIDLKGEIRETFIVE